jgi:competence protein ComEA
MDDDRRRRSALPYAVGTVLLVLLGLRAFGGAGGDATPAVDLDGASSRPAPERRADERIWVHVAGVVRRPGLYRIASDARVGAAVDAAGGLGRRADPRAVNLAAKVQDGQQIVVPARGERPTSTAPSVGDAGRPAASPGAKLSLSSATVEQLDALDGIGPTLAQRIVAWRDAHGGFTGIDQLREVEGIGEKRFEALREAVEP